MKFKAEIDVMPLKALLDPQGKAVSAGLRNIGLTSVTDVRVGKHISVELEADSELKAKEMVEEACKKLLANAVMEGYEYKIETVN